MGKNAHIGVDASGLKKGLSDARREVRLLKSEFENLTSSADVLSNKEAQLNKKMEAATSTMRKYEKLTDSYKEKVKDGSKKVEELKNKQADLKTKLEEAEGATTKDEKAVEKLKKQYNTCTKELNKAEKELTDNKILLNQLETDVNNIRKSYNKWNNELIEVNDSMEETGDITELFGTKISSAQDAMGKLTDVANGVRDAVNEVTDSFEDLVVDGIERAYEELKNLLLLTEDYGVKSESALAKTQTLLKGEMYDGADALIREQTKQFGFDYDAVAEGWYLALSSAVPEDKIEGFTETANKLAIGGFTDTKTSVDALSTIINAYKFDHEDADRLASILIATQDKGKATVGELAAELSKVMSTGSLKNLPFEDLMVASSYLTQGGIKAPDAMTALNRMILDLGDISTNASKILVSRTGKTFDELISDGANLRDVLQILGDSGETAALILGEEFIKTKSKLDESLFKDAETVEEVLQIAKDNGADLSVSLSDIFTEIRSQKSAAALFTQVSDEDYTARLAEFYGLDEGRLEEQFNHLINTTENQKNIFKQVWQDVLVEMWMGGDSSQGLQTYFGVALAEVNELSNEFIDAFDFSIIDDIGNTIKVVIMQICNVLRDNKDLIMEVIDSLGNFIIDFMEYLPGIVEEILPELLELVKGFLDNAPALFNFIPLLTDIVSFVIDNIPAIMGVLYTIQGIFSILGAVFEVGGIIIAIEVLAEWLGTTIPAAAAAAGGALAGIAGPIGIAVAAITALITFFVLVYNKSERFREGLGNLVEKITGALSEALTSISDEFMNLLNIMGFNIEQSDALWDVLGEVAYIIAGTLSTALVGIINVFEGIVKHIMYTIELFSLFGDIVRGTFKAIATGDWTDVLNNIKKAMSTALKDILLPVSVLIETVEEIADPKEQRTVTNKTTTTPFVQQDWSSLIADVENYNNAVSTYQTPIINNNNKNITNQNYFYSPDPISQRQINKDMKNLLNEALFKTA